MCFSWKLRLLVEIVGGYGFLESWERSRGSDKTFCCSVVRHSQVIIIQVSLSKVPFFMAWLIFLRLIYHSFLFHSLLYGLIDFLKTDLSFSFSSVASFFIKYLMKKYEVYGLIYFFKIDYHSILVPLNIWWKIWSGCWIFIFINACY